MAAVIISFTMIALSITFLLCGLIITLIGIPLACRKVPMNAFYGLRMKVSFQSETSWYDLNQVGGMLFAMLGFPLILSGALGFFLPEKMLMLHSTLTLAVMSASIGFALYFFLLYAARYQSMRVGNSG